MFYETHFMIFKSAFNSPIGLAYRCRQKRMDNTAASKLYSNAAHREIGLTVCECTTVLVIEVHPIAPLDVSFC